MYSRAIESYKKMSSDSGQKPRSQFQYTWSTLSKYCDEGFPKSMGPHTNYLTSTDV